MATRHRDPKQGASDLSLLEGKSVLITGGASGLGEAYMRAFVAAGAFVTFGDIAEERSLALVEEVGPDHVVFCKCDTTVWTDQLSLFKEAIAMSPSHGLDIVIANAGIGGQDQTLNDRRHPHTEDPTEPDYQIIKTNLIGYMYTAKLALHYLHQQPEGLGRDRCFIMTASMAAYEDAVGNPQYGASKFGVRGLMRGLRQVMPLKGARVNIIAPGFVKTRILPKTGFAKLEASGVQFAEIEDCVKAVLHLANDRTLNGRALAVVSREIDPRGYVDLEADDYKPGEVLTKLRSGVPNPKPRAANKASL